MYAHTKDKKMVPLMMQEAYKPSGCELQLSPDCDTEAMSLAIDK